MTSVSLNILIHTEVDDLHGLLMAMALRERGHQVMRSFPQDLPLRSAMEFHFDQGECLPRLHHAAGILDLDQVDVVCNRSPQRSRPSCLQPEAEIDDSQLQMARESCDVLTDGAFWANAVPAVRRANLRPLQLRMAPASGLRIPATLVSNRPEAIRDFLDRHPRTNYMPLAGQTWPSNMTQQRAESFRVRLEDLPGDESLRMAPGIFQAQVPRGFEVWAQFFGDTSFALRLDSQRPPEQGGPDSWERQRQARERPQALELPAPIHTACRNLMDALGVVSAAFDFIVTPDGEWFFIELKESAQFMFLETWCPELNVLDACCAFLESRDADFQYQRPAQPSRLDAVYDHASCELILREDRRRICAAAATATALRLSDG